MNLTDLASRYENRVCVVTGATSGNGEAVVQALLKMKARVHALGRNQERLLALALAGAETYTMDLSHRSSITTALTRLPEGIDYVFHLAGNALVGDVSDEEVATFWQSDFYGPVQLLEGLKSRIYAGGGIGVVTSVSALLDYIEPVKHYQDVKRAMVSWWYGNQEWFEHRRVGSTLISMGAINTGIWKRTESLPSLTERMVRTFIPGPEKYAPQILEDVALHQPVSYPGVGAKLFPVDDRPTPGVRVTLATNAIKSWFWMFGERKQP